MIVRTPPSHLYHLALTQNRDWLRYHGSDHVATRLLYLIERTSTSRRGYRRFDPGERNALGLAA
jgi:hypothetical protein